MKRIKYILFVLVLFSSALVKAGTIDSLISVLAKQPRTAGKVKVYVQLVRSVSDPDSVLLFANECLELCKKENDDVGCAIILSVTARALLDRDKYDDGQIWAQNGIAAGKKINNDTLIGRCYHTIGFIHYTLGDLGKSAQNYYEALKYAEKSGNKRLLGATYNVLGLNFQGKKPSDPDKAFEYYFKAEKIFREINAPRDLGFVLLRVGSIYASQKKFEQAELYLDQALSLGEKNKLPDVVQWTLEIYADMYRGKGEPKKALPLYLKAWQSAKGRKDAIGSVSSLKSVANVLNKMREYKLAMMYTDTAVDICIKNKITSSLTWVWRTKSGIYENLGDFTNALLYYKRSIALKDSFFKIDNVKNANELEKKYQTEKKEKEINEKQSELLLQRAEHEKQQTQRNVFVFGTIVLLFFSIFIFRGYKQKQRANEMIEAQKKQMEEKNQLIEEKQKEILDSIYYARRIQQALITNERYFEKELKKLNSKSR